jgi:hypothetical protein
MSGLFFMLMPGTFLGVWNLFQVTARGNVGLVSPAWLQAHGHAQVFGWIGSFILGIGFYSVPRLRTGAAVAVQTAWTCWVLWTAGVALRWSSTVYDWHTRELLPLSAALELAAFAGFIRLVARHRPTISRTESNVPAAWMFVVMSATAGFGLTLVANLILCVWLAISGRGAALPHAVDQRFLALVTWGFLAPFVWGFSLRWLPVFLGLAPSRRAAVVAAVAANVAGVLAAIFWSAPIAGVLFATAALLIVIALRIFDRPVQQPKTRGVHRTFPAFVRTAYAWLIVASALAVAAARWDVSGGIWGASRHAFTVGFVSTMVFAIGQRVLPEFAGLRRLWSPQLMFMSLLLLGVGCCLRVSSEILAYQQYAAWAWPGLPVSAVTEMAAVTCFALNLTVTILVPSEAPGLPHLQSAAERTRRHTDSTPSNAARA